jgi:hypothetical protein
MGMFFLLMIVDEIHVVSVAIVEAKDDAPVVVFKKHPETPVLKRGDH